MKRDDFTPRSAISQTALRRRTHPFDASLELFYSLANLFERSGRSFEISGITVFVRHFGQSIDRRRLLSEQGNEHHSRFDQILGKLTHFGFHCKKGILS